MSKVNVDEIQVGDLVEMPYRNIKWLCIVTHVDLSNDRFRGIWSDDFKEDWETLSDLTGHWKVINFEEETKVDELKVYTGKETLKALMERKILGWATDQFKLDGEFLYEKNGPNEWSRSYRSISFFMENKFTEVVTPQVGDWVKVTHSETKALIITGEITEVDNLVARIEDRLISLKQDWEILSPEQITEYKREQAFSKVGRKLNEFKADDIVYVESLGEMAVVVSNVNDQEVRLHKVNIRAGLTAKPHQLTPIAFTEQQVNLS